MRPTHRPTISFPASPQAVDASCVTNGSFRPATAPCPAAISSAWSAGRAFLSALILNCKLETGKSATFEAYLPSIVRSSEQERR